jgi:NAD(P)-dependent dehydrogenase (short-subunit alcohol dehydrogenase family)
MTEKKIALVTGASSGFGERTAMLLAASGYRVFGPVAERCPTDLQGSSRSSSERHGCTRSPRSWKLLDRATRVGGDQPEWDDERRLDIVRRRRSRTIR